jgi:hAT family C-terminal dimerisation region
MRIDITMELDHYLQEELVLKGQNFNVLTWWMSNGSKFPTLRKIARDIYVNTLILLLKCILTLDCAFKVRH